LTILYDIIFQWWSYVRNSDQNVFVEYELFFKSLNLPPQIWMSWNGLTTLAHCDECVAWLTLIASPDTLPQHNGQGLDYSIVPTLVHLHPKTVNNSFMFKIE
jgi:hypothetical protein